MSITISTDVFCDVCGGTWVHGTTGPRPDSATARKVAKRQGWVRVKIDGKKKDVCPDCQSGPKEPEEES